jgi:hypothetical protein
VRIAKSRLLLAFKRRSELSKKSTKVLLAHSKAFLEELSVILMWKGLLKSALITTTISVVIKVLVRTFVILYPRAVQFMIGAE